MNSLQDLNYYSATGISFTDDRAYNIVFTPVPATNFTISLLENQEHAVNVGTDITSLTSLGANLTYTVNVGAVAGATIRYANSLPAGVTLTTYSNGVNIIRGIANKNIWDQIKYPIVTMPIRWANAWSYTATITYPNTANVSLSNTISWTTNVSVTALNQLSSANVSLYGNSQSIITGVPQIQNLNLNAYATNDYNLTITPSSTLVLGNITANGNIGGTVTGNNITGGLTITGNMNQVNNHLNHLYYTPPSNTFEQDFNLNYYLFNPNSAFTSNTTQTLQSFNGKILGAAGSFYYNINTVANVSQGPLIIDSLNTGNTYNAPYAITITSTPPEALANVYIDDRGFSAGPYPIFDTDTKIAYFLFGDKVTYNNIVNNGLRIVPATDFNQNFLLNFKIHTPSNPLYNINPGNPLNGTLATYYNPYKNSDAYRSANVIISNVSVTNPNVIVTISGNVTNTRTYTVNNADQLIFATNSITINETISNANYVVSFSSNIGYFGFSSNNITANLTLSGTKANINSQIPTIKFYPLKGVAGTNTFTYKQWRDGTNQFNENILLIGAYGSGNPSTVTYTITSNQYLELDYSQRNYLTADILIVGAGAACGPITNFVWPGVNSNYKPDLGGGGGGEIKEYFNQSFGNANVYIGVGRGGILPIMDGGNSNVIIDSTTLLARGGLGYTSNVNGYYGGKSGNGYAGGKYKSLFVGTFNNTSYYTQAFGGGGGAGGAGGAATGSNVATLNGGTGGAGITSTITGQVYGHGGSCYSDEGTEPANSGYGGGWGRGGANGVVVIKFKD
jgi:hypothetical protein